MQSGQRKQDSQSLPLIPPQHSAGSCSQELLYSYCIKGCIRAAFSDAVGELKGLFFTGWLCCDFQIDQPLLFPYSVLWVLEIFTSVLSKFNRAQSLCKCKSFNCQTDEVHHTQSQLLVFSSLIASKSFSLLSALTQSSSARTGAQGCSTLYSHATRQLVLDSLTDFSFQKLTSGEKRHPNYFLRTKDP